MGKVREVTRGVSDAWERFWFSPAPTSTLGIIRIAFGFLMLGWTLSIGPDLLAFFSRDGIVPSPAYNDFRWGILRLFPSDAAVIALWVALLVASGLLVLGLRTRLASVVVFLGVMSFERRNPYIFNSGDGLVRILAFYLMLAPAGAALSLDRWRRFRSRFWESPVRPLWALRLIQVQLSVIYISTVWAKLRGDTWNDGTAVSFAMRLEDLERLPLPSFLTESLFWSNALTFGTLAIGASLGILVWNRRARPWVLAFGIALHLFIAATIMVGFFSAAIFVTYLSFMSGERAERIVQWVRRRLGKSRRASLQHLAGPEATPREALSPTP